MIELQNISKTYKGISQDVCALKNVELKLYPGDKVLVKGPSGAGKSTLLNIIGLVDAKFDGDYILNGSMIEKNNAKQNRKLRNAYFSFIFQEYELIENDSVFENVALPLLYRKKKANEIKKEVNDMLIKVGLLDKMKEKVSHLSGGQRQRIAIARALVYNPQIILADEPTGSLDKNNAKEMYKLLVSLMKEDSILIVVSHNDYFDCFANRRFEIDNGNCKEIMNLL